MTVNISLAYFLISIIIRKDVDEYTAIVQANGKFRLQDCQKQNISVAEISPNYSKAKMSKVTRFPSSFLTFHDFKRNDRTYSEIRS